MTIIYQYKVATTSLGGFAKLLAAWKGSVYKLMFKEMLIFAGAYFLISITYRLALTPDQKLLFEKIVTHCNTFTSLIPVSFVLGFYVSFVVKRWWEQFMNVPWPDRTLFIMNTYLHSDDDRARIMRRTIARYMLLGLIIICRSVSVAVMKRFPTMDHLIEAGFATKEEIEMFKNTKCKYNKFWVPLMWANNILIQARRERKIDNDYGLRMIIEQLAAFRDRCSLCFVYDWITIPLVYTQVATLSVYMFFATCLLGRQYLDTSKEYPGYDIDFYFPLFTLLQFFFYMGWLKVAEQLINPFGEDDDDFDINWLLDRHTEVAFSLVDQCYGKYPKLVQDKFWNDEVVPDLPYTEASKNSKKPNYLGSTYNLSKPSTDDQRLFVPHVNVNGFGVRNRNKDSLTSNIGDSVISLFTGRGNVPKQYYDSRETLCSVTGSEKMFNNLHSNGGPGYTQLPSIIISEPRQRRASADVPVNTDELNELRRERASTDCDQRGMSSDLKSERERKFSTPVNFPFFSREENKTEDTLLPKPPSRSIVGGYTFTEKKSRKQGNDETDTFKTVWLKGCDPQQKFCIIPLKTHKPTSTTASTQTSAEASINDLEILLSKLVNNDNIKIDVLVTKKNGDKSKINIKPLLGNIGEHKEVFDGLSPSSMSTQTIDPVIHRDMSCQTVDPDIYREISCQTVAPKHQDISCQTVDPVIHRNFSSQTESRQTTTECQTATPDSTDASVQAAPLSTSVSVQAVPQCIQAVVQTVPTLITPAIRYAALSKTSQVQTTQASNPTTIKDLYSQGEPRLEEACANKSKDSVVLASTINNVDTVSGTKLSTVHGNEHCSYINKRIQIGSASPDGRGRTKWATNAAAGEAPLFSGIVDFKRVFRCNLLRFKNHSATLPGKVPVIPKSIQYSCPVPMMGIAFPNKIRKPRLEFILGDEPTVQLTSSAALLDPTYFSKKTESCRQEEDGIVQERLLNDSSKEKFDIASLIYIDSFGDFCMNHSVMMDMFGYDPRDSPFLPSGYEASNDLPKDLDSVYVPSIRSRDIVFFKNEDESFKEIGRGSYGVVYLGRLLKTSKKIVVKDFFNETVCWEFVEHEAQIVAMLQGKDITPTFHGLLTSTINENDHSLVQDFFGSGSIETILKNHDELSAASWIQICINTSKTLLKIHRCHVLHNDVKADNILVDLDGFDVRFIDFGMSTFRKGLEFTASPDYMSRYQFLAPEVRENCHSTPQADVFSLGFLFGQIMTQAKVVQLRPLWKACTSVRALSRPRLPNIIATLEELFIKFAA